MRLSGFSQAVLISARGERPPTSIPAEKTVSEAFTAGIAG